MQGSSKTVIPSIIHNVVAPIIFMLMGVIKPRVPVMTKLLNILDPRMFPRAISPSPFSAATNEVDSSGRLVPIATMVRPIMGSVRCVSMENSVAP